MPADYLASHPENADGSVVLATDPQDRAVVLTYADDPELRRTYWLAAMNRAVPANLGVLDRLLRKRHELARLLGYATWADYITEDKMLASAEEVRAFVERVVELSRRQAEADYAELLEEKRRSDAAADVVHDWERAWLGEKVRKRRFDFETVFPILDYARELSLVQQASAELLARSGIPRQLPPDVLELLVTTFRDLRASPDGTRPEGGMDQLNAVMSTAEAVNVAHAVGVRSWFLEQRDGSPADLVDCIAGTVAKDDADDRAKLRRYFEQKVAKKAGAHWRAYFEARHRLP